jgi:hypothetical protein
MNWPFRYPGDSYRTNVFSRVIIVLEDIVEDIRDNVVDFVDNIKEEIDYEHKS